MRWPLAWELNRKWVDQPVIKNRTLSWTIRRPQNLGPRAALDPSVAKLTAGAPHVLSRLNLGEYRKRSRPLNEPPWRAYAKRRSL